MDNLPEDVLVELLLLLPIKSLICMSSVCKSLRSRILNPNFVNIHMVRTMTNPNTNDCFIYHDLHLSPHNKLSIVNVNFLDRDINYLDFPLHLPKPCYVVGSCNGLLCIAHKQSKQTMVKRIYLWNPATRQVKCVRKYTNIKINENYFDVYDVSLGFCFDFSSGDYKVVRIVTYRSYCVCTVSRVEVYSLIKDYWKEIKVEFRFEFICPATVKGSLYWIREHKLVHHQLALVSFNAESENFCTISLPDDMCIECISRRISLFEFKESVAITYTGRERENENTSIWILDDDSCWSKKFTITRPSPIKEIVGCLKTGEFVGNNYSDELFLYDSVNNGELFLYDSVNDEVKHTQLKLVTRRTYNYHESLVTLNYPSRSLPKKGKDRTSKRY